MIFTSYLNFSQACSKVCEYVDRVRRNFLEISLDGVNRMAVCTQLAIRLHHAVVDNFFRFSYSSTGAQYPTGSSSTSSAWHL